MKSKILFLLALTAALMPSCKKHTDYSQYRQPLPVEVLRIDTLTVVSMRNYVGTIEEATSLNLSFPLGGKITGVYVKKNAHVQAGDILARVDDTQQRSLLVTAQATLRQAEDGYARLKQMHDESGISEVKWVEMQTQLEKARAAVEAAQKNLDDCVLRSPQRGVISECDLREGQQLLPGQRAVTLIDVSAINVLFAVPENEVAAVSIGSEGHILIPALDNRIYSGRISERNMKADRLSHSYEMKIALSNADAQLLPGMVCKVRLAKDAVAGFIVPASCMQVREKTKTVWTIDDNDRARLREVDISSFAGNGVIVTHGLQQGDRVVVSGWQKLYEGAEVIEN